MSFGGDEVFLAGAESIKKRMEEFGVHVTLEVGEGMYHSYAMMPLVRRVPAFPGIHQKLNTIQSEVRPDHHNRWKLHGFSCSI